MNFLQAQVDPERGQQQDLSSLFALMRELWEQIDDGDINVMDAHDILIDASDRCGIDISEADLYDLMVYVRFRTTGNPRITVH